MPVHSGGRPTSSSPSSTASKFIASDQVREGWRNIVASARIEPAHAALADHLDADAVPFPFGRIVGRCELFEIGLLHRIGQHDWPKQRRRPFLGFLALALQPLEERGIGWRQPIPKLFDLVDLDTPEVRDGLLGKPRRDADPEATGDQLDEREASRNADGVEQARQYFWPVRTAGPLQFLDDVAERHRMVAAQRLLRLWPDQRHRLGEVADIVVGIAEQHRVHALGDERTQHRRLHGRDRQVAGDGRQRQPAIRILDRAEIVDQQPQLAVARRRQHQAIEELGEAVQSITIVQSPSSS